MYKFLHHNNNDDAKVIAIHWVFSEDSQAKKHLGKILSFHDIFWLKSLTKTAISACEAPPIMFGTKLLWPGASKMVKCFFSVSK